MSTKRANVLRTLQQRAAKCKGESFEQYSQGGHGDDVVEIVPYKGYFYLLAHEPTESRLNSLSHSGIKSSSVSPLSSPKKAKSGFLIRPCLQLQPQRPPEPPSHGDSLFVDGEDVRLRRTGHRTKEQPFDAIVKKVGSKVNSDSANHGRVASPGMLQTKKAAKWLARRKEAGKLWLDEFRRKQGAGPGGEQREQEHEGATAKNENKKIQDSFVQISQEKRGPHYFAMKDFVEKQSPKLTKARPLKQAIILKRRSETSIAPQVFVDWTNGGYFDISKYYYLLRMTVQNPLYREYKAVEISSSTPVVIKGYNKKACRALPVLCRRLLTALELLTGIDHPNICKYLGYRQNKEYVPKVNSSCTSFMAIPGPIRSRTTY